MNALPSRFAVAVCFTLAAAAGDARANDDFAITGVAVLPMNSERVLEDRTVVIRDGVIASVDETATEVPDDIPVIDGRARYLLPGLADLHVHLREEDELVNYLAWGVTTVMHFGGSGGPGLRQLELRREIEAGILLGPNILATDRILDGDPAIATGAHSVDSAEEARRIVRQLRDDGSAFVKIYNNVSQEVFHAIVDEAREQALPVFGHIPRNFGLRWGLDRGGNQALVQALVAIAREHEEDPDMWPRVLAHRLAMEGYEARAGRRRLTGEWILYAVHEGRSHYLTLGTYEEGRDPEALLARLRQQCAAEWPFLFEEWRGLAHEA